MLQYKDPPENPEYQYDVGRNRLIKEIVETIPPGKCVLRKDLLAEVIEMRMPLFEQQMKDHTYENTGIMPRAIPASELRKMKAFKRYKNACIQIVSKIIENVGSRPGYEIMYQEFNSRRIMTGVKRIN